MKRKFSHIVVGLGGIGSAAAYWLARRAGTEVLGLEQFRLGHERGASHDHSRIVRLSYHTPEYVALAQRAFEAWGILEEEWGERLIAVTGGLDLWPPESMTPVSDYSNSLAACNVPFELLDAAEIQARWPGFRLHPATVGLWQEAGGIAPAMRCNAAHVNLARAHGATLREQTRVTSVGARRGEVRVETNQGVFSGGRLVIAADAWTNELLAPLGVRLPLSVTQEQVTYFAAARPDLFSPDRFPVWIWMGEPSFYGFPAYGQPGPKVGQDVGGREVTARSRTFEPDPEALMRVKDFLGAHLPDALGPEIETKTCLYTMPPDRDFIIDRLPDHPEVLVAQGAAHGFKFASLFGRILSELAIDGTSDVPLQSFRITRPTLASEASAATT